MQGAREVLTIEEPMAAALASASRRGTRRQHDRRHRWRTTENRIISLAGVVFSKSIRVRAMNSTTRSSTT